MGPTDSGMPEDDGSASRGAHRPKQPPVAGPAAWLGGLVLGLAGFTFGWDKVRAGMSSPGSASELDIGILLIFASLSAVVTTVWWQWKTRIRRR